MHDARILLAEDTEGVLSQARDLLAAQGYQCTYTRDGREFATGAVSEDVDIMFATVGLVHQALPHLPTAESNTPQSTTGYMIELPGFTQPHDPPHLRRSILQRLCESDTAEDIVEFVRTSLPRVLLLRQTRAANRYMRLVRDALSKARAAAEEIGGNRPEPHSAMASIAETLSVNAAFESMFFFIQPTLAKETECRHQRCEHFITMARALRDTIDVLRATKNHFKSKELGELRKRLEATLDSCLLVEHESSNEQ